MFTLNATDQTLEIVLGGVVTTNELPFVCAFADHDAGTPAFTPAPQDGISNGTTPVTVMGSPASGLQRQLKTLAVFNDDTVAAVVILRFNNGGTIRPIFETSVPTKGTFIYTDGDGPKVIDSGGNILSAPDAFVARTNVAEVITAAWDFAQEIDAQAGVDISGGTLKIGGTEIVSAGRALSNITNIAQLIGVNKTSPGAQLHVVSGDAARIGLIVDTAASPSADVVQFKNNGSQAIRMFSGIASSVSMETQDNGSGRAPMIVINRNSNVSTPAAGFARFQDKGATSYRVWADDAGLMRRHTADPTNANDTAGVVIGDQTSWFETKNILGPALPAEDAVRSVAALAFEQFEYKERSRETWDGANQRFNGLVVRDRKTDWWATNCAPNQTPALNAIELFARYGLTIQSLIAEVKALGGFAWL